MLYSKNTYKADKGSGRDFLEKSGYPSGAFIMKVVLLVNAGVLIDCDISKLTEQDYQDINEIYLDKLLIAFVNQSFESRILLS